MSRTSEELRTNPNPWRNAMLTPEAPRRSRVSRVQLALVAAGVATTVALLGMGDSNPTTPKPSTDPTETLAPSPVPPAIEAYIDAIAEGRGAPDTQIDVTANPEGAVEAAQEAYMDSYTQPGLQAVFEQEPRP